MTKPICSNVIKDHFYTKLDGTTNTYLYGGTNLGNMKMSQPILKELTHKLRINAAENSYKFEILLKSLRE